MQEFYRTILYFMFALALFVFVSAAGQYFSILTGSNQYNVFFRILFELVFRLRYTIIKRCRLTDFRVLSIIQKIVHGTSGQMAVYGQVCNPQIVQCPQLRFGPYYMLWVTSQYINCHIVLSAMNYLINIILYAFIFSICLCQHNRSIF